MANVVVVGAQWGDEGKGKIVDWLSERADVIARFQGGHNAGHTLVIDGKVYKLHALPSGVVRGGKLSVIGNGVVLDPWHLVKEIETVRAQGVEISARNADDRRKHPADPADPRRAGPRARRSGLQGHQDRHHRPRHRPVLRRQGGPPLPSALPIWPMKPRWKPASTARCSTTMPLRKGLGIEPVDRDALIAQLREIARADPALCRARSGKC